MSKIQLGTKIVGGYSPYYGRTLNACSTYPNVWIKDSTVNVVDLEDKMTPVFAALNTLTAGFQVFVITSGKDSFSVHKNTSLHKVGRAIDISFKDGRTGRDIVGWTNQGFLFQKFKTLINSGGLIPTAPEENFRVISESDHIHVQYSPKKKDKVETVTSTPDGEVDSGSKQVRETLIGYFHVDPTITSLADLISKNPLFEGMSEGDLKALKGPDGVTNEDRIKATYNNPDEDSEEKEQWPLLKPGTLLYVKPTVLKLDSLATESSNQVKEFRNWKLYQTETQEQLSKLENYRPVYEQTGKYEFSSGVTVRYINSFFRVWIFSKTLNRVVDVTPFCKVLATNTSTGGDDSFSIELVALGDKYFQDQDSYFDSLSLDQSVWAADAFEEKILSLWERIFSNNDIVFLAFEEMLCEKSRNWSIDALGIVENDELADQYYDFIGLVTGVGKNSNAQGFGSVTITGSALNKIFKEDEAIFRPISALEGSFAGSLIIGDVKKRGFMRRMFSDGEYHSLFTDSLRSIKRTLQFYLNLVSNVGLLPLDDEGKENTDLFSSWGEDRTKLFEIKAENGQVDDTKETLAKGVYQIIKLQIDPQIENRHLSDGAISNPEGTIQSLLDKTCQFPLVELQMDTYKNTYDLICRVPPFSKKAIVEWLEANAQTGFGTIPIENVASENLGWETEFYTWFELEPRGSIIPMDELVSLCWIPTLFLSDFIDVWGSRKLSVVSPYTVVGSSNETNADEIGQAVNDLCFMVESFFYLPFTRRGTITLAVPDRRIKKGQWIKYEKTGEIFYVEGVQQSAMVSATSVQRQTILTVSRGLLEKYINPRDKKGYFDIIDFDALAKALKGFYGKNGKATTYTPSLQKDLFKFFSARKQW